MPMTSLARGWRFHELTNTKLPAFARRALDRDGARRRPHHHERVRHRVPAGPLRRAIRVPVRAGAKHYVTLDACMLAEGTETTAASLIAETKPVRQG